MSANRRPEQGPTVDPDHSPAHSGLFVTHDSSTVTRGHAQSGSMGTSAAAARRGHAPPRSARFPPSRDEHVCWPRSPQGHAFCALAPRAGAALASPRGQLRPQPTKGGCEPAWGGGSAGSSYVRTYARTHLRTTPAAPSPERGGVSPPCRFGCSEPSAKLSLVSKAEEKTLRCDGFFFFFFLF